MDNNRLAHTKWNCKYHIVFAPKYRRQEIYGMIKEDIGKLLRCVFRIIRTAVPETSGLFLDFG